MQHDATRTSQRKNFSKHRPGIISGGIRLVSEFTAVGTRVGNISNRTSMTGRVFPSGVLLSRALDWARKVERCAVTFTCLMSTPSTPPSPATASSHKLSSLDQWLGKFSLLPHADIILRSSDAHDIQVQKSYLIDASSVLGERIMAALHHGTGPEGEPYSTRWLKKWLIVNSAVPCEATQEATAMDVESIFPVVQLPEGHTILSSLLTFVFPVPSVLPPAMAYMGHGSADGESLWEFMDSQRQPTLEILIISLGQPTLAKSRGKYPLLVVY